MRAGEMDRIYRIQDLQDGRRWGFGESGGCEDRIWDVRTTLRWVEGNDVGEKGLKGQRGWAGWWDDGGGIF